MTSVVIVHAAEDTPPARALAEKLRRMGVQPVVEQTGEALQSAIRQAKALVALWSPRSAQSASMIEDVKAARALAPVIHARMQNAAPPSDFSADPSIDLTGWRGEDNFEPWQTLAATVAAKTGVAVPAAAPAAASAAPTRAAPSPFFQPGAALKAVPQPPPQPASVSAGPRISPLPSGPEEAPVRRDPPPPRMAPPPRSTAFDDDEPKNGGPGKLALIGLVTFIVVAALGGGGYFAWSQMQGSQASAAAWEHLDKSNPEALRAFLRDNPGALRDQAQGVLATLEQQRYATARQTDTVDAYNAFIDAFPHSDHALEARGRIAELQSAPVPPTVTDPLTGIPTTATTTDPDLLPPGTDEQQAPPTAQTPAPSSGNGPVTLQPPPGQGAPMSPSQPSNP